MANQIDMVASESILTLHGQGLSNEDTSGLPQPPVLSHIGDHVVFAGVPLGLGFLVLPSACLLRLTGGTGQAQTFFRSGLPLPVDAARAVGCPAGLLDRRHRNSDGGSRFSSDKEGVAVRHSGFSNNGFAP